MATNRVDYQDYGRGQHKRQQISFLTDLGIKVENIETIRHVDQLRFNLPLEQFTHRTITDRHLLESEMERIVSTGYAVDNEEYVLGVSCVAVPVRDSLGEVVAAIAVHAATARLPLNQAMEHIPKLKAASERISQTLS